MTHYVNPFIDKARLIDANRSIDAGSHHKGECVGLV